MVNAVPVSESNVDPLLQVPPGDVVPIEVCTLSGVESVFCKQSVHAVHGPPFDAENPGSQMQNPLSTGAFEFGGHCSQASSHSL